MPEPRERGRTVRRTLLRLVALGVVLVVALVGVPNAVVVVRAHGQSSGSVDRLPRAQVAIVPGALVRSDGSLSPVLRDRVDGAVVLYRQGRVAKILVSGDNGRATYDETDAMRDAVLAACVPPTDVFTDYAGFSTWATMRRARTIFDVRTAVVVTQGDFAARSVDLGRAAGLDVHALTIDADYGWKGQRAALREVVARTKGFVQATFKPRVTGGARLPITGDGRTSWAEDDAPVVSC